MRAFERNKEAFPTLVGPFSSILLSAFSTLLLLVLARPVHGQEYAFEAGAAAGLNTSQISGDNLSGFHQFGLATGLFVARPLSEKSELDLQILFSQKGSRKTPNAEKGDYTSYNLRVNYIDLPLSFHYELADLDLFGGPYLGARVGSSKESDHNGPIESAGRPGFEPYDIGVQGGLSYRWTEKLAMDLRFSNSVLAAREHTGNSTANRGTAGYLNRGQYHTVVSFLVKYRILESER